jgi:S2P endopeptidase
MPAALLQVTDYLPRLGLFMLGLPRVLEQLLEYTFKVSAVLALVNMAPVIYFDGQAALDVLILSAGTCSPTKRSANMTLQCHSSYTHGFNLDTM